MPSFIVELGDGRNVAIDAADAATALVVATRQYGSHARRVIGETTVANLVHAVGVADGTVDDVGAAFNQATLNNNFRELSAKLNALLDVLRADGVIS